MQARKDLAVELEDLPVDGLEGVVPKPEIDSDEDRSVPAAIFAASKTANGATPARTGSVAGRNGKLPTNYQHGEAVRDENSLQHMASSLYGPDKALDFVSIVDDATLDSSRSVYAHDFNMIWENGRLYCGSYYMPIDVEELTRQHMVHEAFLKFFDGQLTTVPLEAPKGILDIGTGTGDWAIGMAEQYPHAEIIGTDIAPVQETGCVPSNVWFENDDAELEWTRAPDSYDLIHLRNMTGAFANWRFVYGQCFKALRPGGWIEVIDQHDHHVVLSKFAEDSHIRNLVRDMGQAAALAGRPRSQSHLQPDLLEELGFVDVKTTVYDLSMDPKGTPWGKFWLLTLLCSLEASALRLLTTYMGRDPNEVRRRCRAAEKEVKELADDPERVQFAIYKLKIMVGRKPDYGENTTDKGGSVRPDDDASL
jgi:trans-aconitate methyltransferase